MLSPSILWHWATAPVLFQCLTQLRDNDALFYHIATFKTPFNARYNDFVSLRQPCMPHHICRTICDLIMFVFPREHKWGLNTYLYAPKDDYKHRMYWRELYSPEEAGQFCAFIRCLCPVPLRCGGVQHRYTPS